MFPSSLRRQDGLRVRGVDRHLHSASHRNGEAVEPVAGLKPGPGLGSKAKAQN